MLSLPSERKESLVRDDVRRHGWGVIYVFDPDDETNPPFAYTVGLYETFHHPEITIVGTTVALANPMINIMGERIVEDGARFEADRYYDRILEGFDCDMHPVRPDCQRDYVGWDLWYDQGGQFPLLQCVYPCGEGHFTWDPDAPPLLRACQPIIGGLRGH